MTKKVTMEVFRAGKQTDSSGHTKEWTEKDLDKIVEKFNQGDDIPATIGHPEEDGPAWGWFKKVYRKGNTLFAELSDVVDEFGTMLKKRMFKKRSIALRPDLSLRHIAFLGAAAPAVKGLEDFAFKQKDEFSAFDFEIESDDKSMMETMSRVFKSWFTELNKEKEFQSLEDTMSKELEQKIADLTQKVADGEAAFSSFKKETEEKEVKFNETIASEKKRADEAEKKIKDSFEASREKEFSDFLDEQIEAGFVLPANKAMFMQTMKTLDGQESMDFAEDGKTKKVSQLDVFKKSICAGGELVSFGEKYKKGSTPETAGDQLTAKAKKIARENKVSFSEAFRTAREENPELAKNYEESM